MAKKRTRLHIETHRITTIRINERSTWGYCQLCKIDVAAYKPLHAAAILQISVEDVYELANADKIHTVENKRNILLFCGNSLENLKQASGLPVKTPKRQSE